MNFLESYFLDFILIPTDARTIKLTADSPIEFHDACEPRCQQILGFMLCGLDETRDQLLL